MTPARIGEVLRPDLIPPIAGALILAFGAACAWYGHRWNSKRKRR